MGWDGVCARARGTGDESGSGRIGEGMWTLWDVTIRLANTMAAALQKKRRE
jgi:hypothetical protein